MIATEETLTTAAVGGDADAMAELLRKYDAELAARLAGRVSPVYQGTFDIDDVLQVTYLEAFLRIGQFSRNGPGAFLAWLTQLAENNLRDAIRALERDKRPPRARQLGAQDSYCDLFAELSGSASTPSRRAGDGEVKTLLDAALAALPPDYAKVVRLYDLEGQPIDAVCKALNRSRGAIHMLRARAHDRLREELGDPSAFFSDGA